MKDRIKRILELEGITNGKFADMLGVTPSTVSHLLSGRNAHPRSDMLNTILSRFPKYDPSWLIGLTNYDEPYRPEFRSGDSPSAEQLASQTPTLFDSTTSPSLDIVATDENTTSNDARQNPIARVAMDGKKPSFVVVFYQDGSCEKFSMR